MKILIAVILVLLSVFSVFAQKQAEVIVVSTFLRKSPDSASEKVQTVQKGDKLNLEKNQDTNGWYYVSTADKSVKGWIRKDTVRSAGKAAATVEKPQKVVAGFERTRKITSLPGRAANAPPSPAISTAKPADDDEEVIRVDTEEVSINVRVVDTNNHPVKNLNQSHFKIYEDDVLQPLTSLATTEIPIINALVIDNSRSLRSQLKNIIEAAKTIVVKNSSIDESAVIRFVSADTIEVVQDFTLNKSSLIEGLDGLFVEGGQTAIVDAVYLAAKKIGQHQSAIQKDDAKLLRALILVSDGDDRSSSHNEEQLFELLRNSPVQIYAVGFVNNLSKEPDEASINRYEKAKSFLNRLTHETGGKAYFPNSIDELPQIASDISSELHTQYLISYTPTNENRDGTFRKLKVVVDEGANNEKRIAITRKGRISTANQKL